MKCARSFFALWGVMLLSGVLWSSDGGDLRDRSDQIPQQRFDGKNDVYMEGYLQALLDMHYYEYQLKVRVQEHDVYLSNMPENRPLSESILSFVKEFPGVEKVVEEPSTQIAVAKNGGTVVGATEAIVQGDVDGIWFPQSNLLFPTLVADPLHVAYAGSLRFGDDVIGTTSSFISFGDHFPLYRWLDIGPFHGDMQLGIEGCAWAFFDMKNDSDLINTDYYVALPLSYTFDNWSFRTRFYHVSSHLGDEYILKNPGITRYNISYEAADFFALYNFSQSLLGYGGAGWVFRTDKNYKIDPAYVEGGAELRLFGTKNVFRKLYLQPFAAMHMRFWQDNNWQADKNFALGVEWSKLQNVGRKVRLFLTHHQGQSFIGQFRRDPTNYWGFVVSYGF